jgi:hypothetical protein
LKLSFRPESEDGRVAPAYAGSIAGSAFSKQY